jgi:putative DNA primase/helicase
LEATALTNSLINKIVDHLVAAGAVKQGYEYRFYCPECGVGYEQQACSFNQSSGLWKCHRCETTGNATKLAELLNIFHPDVVETDPKIYFPYDNLEGDEFRVVKPPNKRFWQETRDGSGSWRSGLHGMKPFLFNMKMISETPKTDWVLVVEGEKDVRTAKQLGITATTNPMGAGNWRPEYSETLSAFKVAVIPDNDAVGLQHAVKVANSLLSHAHEVRLLLPLPEVPQKGDLTDWVEAGGTCDQLLALVEEAQPHVASQEENSSPLNSVRVADVATEEVEWLWRPYIPSGRVTILEGDPGTGKSFLTTAITASITTERQLPDAITDAPGSVLILSAEDDIGDTIRPRLEKAEADLFRVRVVRDPLTLDDEGLTRLESEMVLSNPRLVIIDPIMAYVGSGTDVYRPNEVRSFMSKLSSLASRTGTAVLVIRHLTKSKASKAIYNGLGSIDFVAASRSVLFLGEHPDDKSLRVLFQIKNNYAEMGRPQEAQLNDGGFRWTKPSDLDISQVTNASDAASSSPALDEAVAFLESLLSTGPVASAEVYEMGDASGISKPTIRRAMKRLKIKPVRVSKSGSRGSGLWSMSLPHSEAGQDAHAQVMNALIEGDVLERSNNHVSPAQASLWQ